MAKKNQVHLHATTPGMRAATSMRHRDFQRECILRGLPFDDVLHLDHTKLVVWFVENYDNGQDLKRLSEFDAFVDAELKRRGYKQGDALLHPSLKFGYIPNNTSDSIYPNPMHQTSTKIKAPKPQKSPQKRERDNHGLIAGTKKSYTYQLAEEGKSLPEIVELVKKAFPEAQDSSIKIWVGRVKKAQNV